MILHILRNGAQAMQAETPFALSVSYHEELFDTLRANSNVIVGHVYMNYWELANFMDKIPNYRIGKMRDDADR
ncbi:MAG: hypothetical protein GY801_13770 [bacterium]|nr:hypothetical protein [bacterium]